MGTKKITKIFIPVIPFVWGLFWGWGKMCEICACAFWKRLKSKGRHISEKMHQISLFHTTYNELQRMTTCITSGTTSDNEWQQMATSDNEWQQMTTSDNEWRRVTTNNNEWQQITTNDKHWQRMTTSNKKWRQ